MTNEQRTKIPPRPPLIKGGWGDLNGGLNDPHHEFNSHVNFFMTVFKIVGEETCMNIS